jgi:hypothetical protein
MRRRWLFRFRSRDPKNLSEIGPRNAYGSELSTEHTATAGKCQVTFANQSLRSRTHLIAPICAILACYEGLLGSAQRPGPSSGIEESWPAEACEQRPQGALRSATPACEKVLSQLGLHRGSTDPRPKDAAARPGLERLQTATWESALESLCDFTTGRDSLPWVTAEL